MRHLIAFTMVIGAALAACAEDNWPQFRGPTGQGISDATGLPVQWGEGKNVKWKVAVHGKAWSSPVIWGNQIWMTTATEDGKELGVVVVDKESGKITRDQKLYDIANPQYCIPFNSYASPTPAIEEGRVYVTWGSPGLACLDTDTGEVLWERRDFVCNHFRAAGSSLFIHDGMLYTDYDGSDYQYVVGLDKQTGKTIWKTNRSIDFKDLVNGKPKLDGDLRKAFSTPRIAKAADGHEELVSLGSQCVYAYEPKTGKELWRVELLGSHSGGSTPVIGDGLIFIPIGNQRPKMVAIRPGGHGVVNHSNVAWTFEGKDAPTRTSPVLVNGRLYVVNEQGVLTCLEARTGKTVWRDRVKGKYSASPLYADGKIYLFSEDGVGTVIDVAASETGPKVIAENPLGDGFMASAAVSGKALYLRSKTHLYRVEQ